MSEKDAVKFAKKNFKSLCAMLDDNKWKYEKDEEKLKITTGAKGDDLPIEVVIKFNTDLEIVSLFSRMPFDVPEDKRAIIAIAVARANYGMIDGSFDFNYKSGNLLFRMTASYAGSLLSKDMYEYMLFVSCKTVDNYNDKFLTVCKKDMNVQEVISLIE